ncbi:hypothetical protein TetV_034 [Tetraselmis virus 1]|uniref:Uncharacterized protein n=1 Tax=Tetraselmis virus 1 TaxID=2060617 RepID=A0A2P0VMK5_9VIRU|nr:hypothetical protein QJ968_gp034 [Tetraselmis virus 1]AUF82126.1 hypothetical protein TetV_034 [Tetraselmis virus 1]
MTTKDDVVIDIPSAEEISVSSYHIQSDLASVKFDVPKLSPKEIIDRLITVIHFITSSALFLTLLSQILQSDQLMVSDIVDVVQKFTGILAIIPLWMLLLRTRTSITFLMQKIQENQIEQLKHDMILDNMHNKTHEYLLEYGVNIEKNKQDILEEIRNMKNKMMVFSPPLPWNEPSADSTSSHILSRRDVLSQRRLGSS